MLFKRVDGRIDINSEISSGNIIVDEEEQRGARTNKFWFNNYEFMYKDVYPLTYEDYAEMIAYRLAKYLGIECASYDLAVYNGNLGVITANLIKDNESEELLSGTEIITQVYTEYIMPINIIMEEYHELVTKYNAKNVYEFSQLPYEIQISLRNELLKLVNNLNVKNNRISKRILKSKNIDFLEIEKIYEYLNSFVDIYNQDFTEMKNGVIKSNNLYDIWSVLEIYARINNVNLNIEDFMNKLINMFIFDIITSQGDRHADNWSIIKNNKNNSIRICPLYDNSGICSLNREKAIKNIIDYVNALNDPLLHDKKKQKIKMLLEATINHSNSGLKVDLKDVENKSKNKALFTKFIAFSSQEFSDKIMLFVNQISEDILDGIFLDIEQQTEIEIPNEIKIIVKTVILSNLEMINEIYNERRFIK